MTRRSRYLAPMLAAAILLPGAALHGQEGQAWLPAEAYFRAPVAAPREPSFHAIVLSSDVLRSPGGVGGAAGSGLLGPDARELHGSAAMGGTIRLWRFSGSPRGGVILGLQTGVFGRFRLESSANELVATDWIVAVPLEARWDRLSGRVRLLHWSAHLGDELLEATDARRKDFTFEALDLVAAYDASSFRLYGGGSLVLRSQLEDAEGVLPGFSDDGTLQVGADWRWHPWSGGRLGLVAGADLQWADRADWRRQVSATAAVEARGSDTSATLGLGFFHGPSPLGQFYLTDESYWGVELRIEL